MVTSIISWWPQQSFLNQSDFYVVDPQYTSFLSSRRVFLVTYLFMLVFVFCIYFSSLLWKKAWLINGPWYFSHQLSNISSVIYILLNLSYKNHTKIKIIPVPKSFSGFLKVFFFIFYLLYIIYYYILYIYICINYLNPRHKLLCGTPGS